MNIEFDILSNPDILPPINFFFDINSVNDIFLLPPTNIVCVLLSFNHVNICKYISIQYGRDNISIVRPANVYGKWDNFDPENAMVIPSIINRITSGESPLVCWGDGTPIRDFIYADDCAEAMIHLVENGVTEPVNLGSGEGVTIKEVAEAIRDAYDKNIEIEWDTTKPKGDAKRLMDTTRAKSHGFSCKTNISDGIKQTLEWFIENKNQYKTRNNYFVDEK